MEKRAVLFAIFILLAVVLALAMFKMIALEMKHVLILAAAVIAVPAMVPLFGEELDMPHAVAGAAGGVIVLMLSANTMNTLIPGAAIVFILMLALFLPLTEVRGMLFKKEDK